MYTKVKASCIIPFKSSSQRFVFSCFLGDFQPASRGQEKEGKEQHHSKRDTTETMQEKGQR